MTRQDLKARRTKIVRRWTAYRVSLAQREIWRQRRARAGRTIDETSDAVDVDLLADLPDGLLS